MRCSLKPFYNIIIRVLFKMENVVVEYILIQVTVAQHSSPRDEC